MVEYCVTEWIGDTKKIHTKKGLKMPAKKKILPERDDPAIESQTLQIFHDCLCTTLGDEDLAKPVFIKPVRFTVEGKVYGGRFVGFVLQKLVIFGIIPKEYYESWDWSPTYKDLVSWLRQLIMKLSPPQIAVAT